MFHHQALTNLKIADTFSMRTLRRMTKIEDTVPVNTTRATHHKHQLSKTARENTSNQAYLTNRTKEQSSNRNAPYKIITHTMRLCQNLLPKEKQSMNFRNDGAICSKRTNSAKKVLFSSGHRQIWWGDKISICNEPSASQDPIA